LSSRFSHSRKIQPTPPVCAETRKSNQTVYPANYSCITASLHVPSTILADGKLEVFRLQPLCNTGTPGIWEGRTQQDLYQLSSFMQRSGLTGELNFIFQVEGPTIVPLRWETGFVAPSTKAKTIMEPLRILDTTALYILGVMIVC